MPQKPESDPGAAVGNGVIGTAGIADCPMALIQQVRDFNRPAAQWVALPECPCLMASTTPPLRRS